MLQQAPATSPTTPCGPGQSPGGPGASPCVSSGGPGGPGPSPDGLVSIIRGPRGPAVDPVMH